MLLALPVSCLKGEAGVVGAVRASLLGGLEGELEALLHKAQATQSAFDELETLAAELHREIGERKRGAALCFSTDRVVW